MVRELRKDGRKERFKQKLIFPHISDEFYYVCCVTSLEVSLELLPYLVGVTNTYTIHNTSLYRLKNPRQHGVTTI